MRETTTWNPDISRPSLPLCTYHSVGRAPRDWTKVYVAAPALRRLAAHCAREDRPVNSIASRQRTSGAKTTDEQGSEWEKKYQRILICATRVGYHDRPSILTEDDNKCAKISVLHPTPRGSLGGHWRLLSVLGVNYSVVWQYYCREQ